MTIKRRTLAKEEKGERTTAEGAANSMPKMTMMALKT